MNKILAGIAALVLSGVGAALAPAAEGGATGVPGAANSTGPSGSRLESGDYVAIVGDSITEQKQYSVFVEDYLLMCKPVENDNLRATQFGWGGETSWGFAARMANDMLRFHCTAATTCFGMNDGGYSPENPDKEKHYHDAQTSVVQQMKKGGVRFIVVGSPGCVDSDSFHKDPAAAAMYNKTLATERDIARKVAEEQGVGFADVFDPMVEVMDKAKAKYGHAYHLAGGDGVHPDANGHLVMAYAFLKGLGCRGDIGTITVDLAGNKAQATEGHQVKAVKDGRVEIESSRYPFCFYGDDLKATSSTKGVIEFLPFNQELNRLMLVVHNAPAGKGVKVTWGKSSKTFSADQLAKGINLAAEFLDNPFSEPFHQVEQVIRQQQNFETPLVKQLIHDLPAYKEAAPNEGETLDRIAGSLIQKDKTLVDASAAAVKPVTHTIQLEVVDSGAAAPAEGAPGGAAAAGAAAPPAAAWDMHRPDNTPPQGFKAEFNGKDLANWKGLVSPDKGPPGRAKMTPEQLKAAQAKADERMRQHWKVEDGVLLYDGGGDSLCTAKDYRNVELWVDWKIEPNGDSGIYLRGSPQVQIWDPHSSSAHGVGSGGLFNNQKPENPHDPLVLADNPVGQWNRFFIRMVGEKVWVWLNGKLVVDGVTLENYWERNKPIYPAGQIELQNHHSHLWFKNIYIRELPREGEERKA